MSPFANNCTENDRVLDIESKCQGKVARTPRDPGSRRTAILFDGTVSPRYVDVMRLRLVVKGVPEENPPIEGEPPPLPVSGPSAMLAESSALEVIEQEYARNAAEMETCQNRYKLLKAANERLDRARTILKSINEDLP